MLFVSIKFLLFLPLAFAVYWILSPRVKWQNAFIIAASYLFYGWNDWRFVALLGGYTLWSFISGLLLGSASRRVWRKTVLWITVALNLGVLCLYKYFDFFVTSFNRLFGSVGLPLDWPTLNLILPIGISFYTFQALSYTIDVYRRKVEPTRNVLSFFAFLSFFPQLVAGPIERADTLLPQFMRRRTFTYENGVAGMKRILWGLFKKMVIADTCAIGVNYIFDNAAETNSLTLMLGAIFFSFQIYGDFSGYSDIAIGCGKLFGINLMDNFNLPYFSKNIQEFWRRWHISLNLWLREYVYFPLGGNRRGQAVTFLNILIVFSLSGLWHGANWTYIAWGLLNGLLILLFIISSRTRRTRDLPPVHIRHGIGHGIANIAAIAVTFILVTFLWVIFRSPNISFALQYIAGVFAFRGGWEIQYSFAWPTIAYIAVLVIIETLNRRHGGGLYLSRTGMLRYAPVRWGFYCIFAIMTFVLAGSESPFIYFQF